MAAKKPAKKAPAGVRGTAASGSAKQKTAAIKQNKNKLHENPIAVYMIQFITGIFAVYILVCFIITGADDIGGIGVLIKNIFYGLFGSAAFLAPFFLCSTAVFLRRDLESGFFKYRVIFSVSCLILYASIMHLSSSESAEVGFGAQDMFDNGKLSVGGGVMGGFFSEILRRGVGQVGAWIFILPLSFIFSIFLFGRTPLDLARGTAKLISEYRTAQKKVSESRALNKGRNRQKQRKPVKITEPPANINQKPEDIDDPFDPFDSFDVVNTEDIQTVPLSGIDEFMDLDDFDDFGENDGISTDKNRKRLIDINPFENENVEFKKIESNKIENIETETGQDLDLGTLRVLESVPQARDDEPELAGSQSYETGSKTETEKEYKIPPLDYLTKDTGAASADYSEELRSTAEKLISTLASFGVKTKIDGYNRGPSITRYEIAPDSGIKVRNISNLVDDISLHLAAGGVRIEAPIPGKAAVGVEVPNKTVSIVHLRTLLEEAQFINAASRITVALGMDVAGNPIYSDVAKMPHLLIAGATGTGKSVCINSIITSILYKATPNDVKLILIDPKKVELSIYDGIPHLLVPVVSDPKKAAGSLAWAVTEMENRYMLMQEKSVRNLENYNKAAAADPDGETLPQIVIIIDELADLMMTAPADVEQSVSRIAAKARAAGMHLILGTQRPSVDVITGLIKANIPSRIAFTVASQINSNIIIDTGGAEKLIGRGDMLYAPNGSLKPIRVQGAFVSEKDILNVVEFWKNQATGEEYDQSVLEEIEQEAARTNTKGAKLKDREGDIDAGDEIKKDSALKSAVEIAIDTGRISTSLLQTKLSLGFNRAARIIDTMEKMNIIGPFEGSKPRKVLITRDEFIEMTMNNDLD
ncbi:MAG: DNA translocase FtsK [Oscillospiraceae bacterium]|nr:DNA translocase FtsK [Oscillospiraceae bacterium]